MQTGGGGSSPRFSGPAPNAVPGAASPYPATHGVYVQYEVVPLLWYPSRWSAGRAVRACPRLWGIGGGARAAVTIAATATASATIATPTAATATATATAADTPLQHHTMTTSTPSTRLPQRRDTRCAGVFAPIHTHPTAPESRQWGLRFLVTIERTRSPTPSVSPGHPPPSPPRRPPTHIALHTVSAPLAVHQQPTRTRPPTPPSTQTSSLRIPSTPDPPAASYAPSPHPRSRHRPPRPPPSPPRSQPRPARPYPSPTAQRRQPWPRSRGKAESFVCP